MIGFRPRSPPPRNTLVPRAHTMLGEPCGPAAFSIDSILSNRQHVVMKEDTRKTVHLAVYDQLADWEIGYATATIRSGDWQRDPDRHDVVTVGLTGAPVTTAGGLTILPDLTLPQLKPSMVWQM